MKQCASTAHSVTLISLFYRGNRFWHREKRERSLLFSVCASESGPYCSQILPFLVLNHTDGSVHILNLECLTRGSGSNRALYFLQCCSPARHGTWGGERNPGTICVILCWRSATMAHNHCQPSLLPAADRGTPASPSSRVTQDSPPGKHVQRWHMKPLPLCQWLWLGKCHHGCHGAVQLPVEPHGPSSANEL